MGLLCLLIPRYILIQIKGKGPCGFPIVLLNIYTITKSYEILHIHIDDGKLAYYGPGLSARFVDD